jgi:membrane protein YdbS with pleckstrin-like domain
MSSEDTLLRTQPKMWKANPAGFIISILLIPTGIGILILFFWWLSTYNRELIVTKTRTRKRTGILSNETTELEHRDVKNIQVEQGPIQNLMGTGTLRLSSAGQAGMELEMNSVENPEGIRDLIYDQRERE